VRNNRNPEKSSSISGVATPAGDAIVTFDRKINAGETKMDAANYALPRTRAGSGAA
jgi:hypothetical protein